MANLLVKERDFTTSYTLTPPFCTADVGLALKISCQFLPPGNIVQKPSIVIFPLDIIKYLQNQSSSFPLQYLTIDFLVSHFKKIQENEDTMGNSLLLQ